MNETDFEILPAHNIEAEQAVLGACLIEPKALECAAGEIGSDMFYRKRHGTIFAAMLALKTKDEPADLVSVVEVLRSTGALEDVGGIEYLSNLSNSVPTAANVDHYCRIVLEKYRNRTTQKIYQAAAVKISEGHDESDVSEETGRKIQELSDRTIKRGFVRPKDFAADVWDGIEHRFNNLGKEVSVTGIKSGYPDLDKMTAGFQRSDLVILAARPAVGKTAFVLNIANNVAVRAHESVAIFSLEMSKEQMYTRMLCAEANVDAQRVRTGALDEDDWPKLTMANGLLYEAPLFFDDTAKVTINDIRAKAKKLHQQQGRLGLIIIDYLQLISSPGRNRQQEVAEISRELKLLARDLNVTVIALSQLSRSCEQRQDKRPMMSDLRESGSIEQDADIVSFLYRDDYYNPESERKNITEVIIAKQRSGPTGTVELVFLKNFNKFVSLERAPGA